MRTFPTQPEQLTADWFTIALRDAGVLAPDRSVTSFDVSSVGEGIGLVGMVVRAALVYDGPPGTGGPDSVVIKFSHPSKDNRAIGVGLRMYEREVRFFNEIAPGVDVPMPACYFAAIVSETGENIIVLEDMHRYRAGDQLAGATVEEAKMAIDAFVPLHAKFWGVSDADPGPLQGLMRIDTTFIEPFMPAVDMTWERSLEQFSYCMTDDVRAAVPQYVAAMREIHREMGRRTMTAVHGDVKVDNLMFGDGDPGLHPVILLDWQAIMISNPMHDAAYVLCQSLNVEDRRAHEDELIRYYYDLLTQSGVTNYSLEQCYEDHDIAALYFLAYAIIVGGLWDGTSERGKRLAEVLLTRAANTITDRGLLRLIPSV